MPSQDTLILKALLKAAPDYVSGNVIARALGISRASVGRRLAKLRRQGFCLEAVPYCGYRLIEEPEGVHPELIEAYLADTVAPLQLLFYPQIDSTNSEAERQLGEGRTTPFIVMAARQTQGRGRRGHSWHSASTGNLYLSFAFHPQLAPHKIQNFTLWMGVSLCHFFNTQHAIPLNIKWPNDLLHAGRKVAGMLTEARVDAEQTRHLIFGLGLNVNDDPGAAVSELAGVTTSLAKAKGQRLSLNPITAALIDVVLKAYHAFIKGEHLKLFNKLWFRYDGLRGQKVTVQNGDQSVSGTARGLDKNGALRLHLESGRDVTLHTGDVIKF